jgi:hypothetical protein
MKLLCLALCTTIIFTVHAQPNKIVLTGLLPSSIDYRPNQSPVKSQEERGTCVTFSVAAIMETFDGVPADLSEQDAYGVVKFKQLGNNKITHGGFLDDYNTILTNGGFIHESYSPYDPKAGLWSNDDNILKQFLQEGKRGIADILKTQGATRYAAQQNDIIYLKENAARDVMAIKRLLAKGNKAVAVSYTNLYLPFWATIADEVITPDKGFYYAVGDYTYDYKTAKILNPNLITDLNNAKPILYFSDTLNTNEKYGGHAVTIVGYNDKGFIIKNSWGTNWGVNGYSTVSYDYHRIFCIEALSISKPNITVAPALEKNVVPTIYLKTTLNKIGTKKSLRLSLFCPKDGGLTPLKTISYEVYEQNPDGTRGALVQTQPQSIFVNINNCFAANVLENKVDLAKLTGKKYWVQVLYTTTTQPLEKIISFTDVTCAVKEYKGY